MKKNYSLRIAGFLLVLVLLSTCLISGTFAKYVTSDNGTDTARVAKWGVTINVQGSSAFNKEYQKNVSSTSITNSVASNSEDKVLAPGTEGTLFIVTTTGSPEVALNAKADFSLTLTGWEITPDLTGNIEYCPLVFTVTKGSDAKEFKIGSEYASIDDLTTALKACIEEVNGDYTPNTNLNTDNDFNMTVTWKWEFEGDNAKDTLLGDLNTAPKISFSYKLTLTQID